MSAMQRFLFWCLNTSENRRILNRWKADGRIPESYWGSLQGITNLSLSLFQSFIERN